MNKLAAEFIGTFWLVLGGCGSAVLAAAFPGVGIGLLGVSLAFGLTVVTIAYSLGHVSGAHLNPAVSLGLWAGGRFSGKELPGYIIAQILGGLAAAGVLYTIATGNGSDVGDTPGSSGAMNRSETASASAGAPVSGSSRRTTKRFGPGSAEPAVSY